MNLPHHKKYTHYSRLTTHVLFLCALFLVPCSFLHAQQKDLKPLIQQIAASKIYLSYIKTGYNVVSGGLRVIRNIKDGDFSLHKDHFDELMQVNPRIRSYAKVATIISMQVQITKSSKQNSNDELRNDERTYCKNVMARLLDDSEATIDALMALITSGELSMTDDQRMQRIDELYKDTQEQYTFVTSFHQQINSLMLQRRSEKVQIDLQRKLQQP